jgi:ABC-type antimicrobial peptide transport system permease subunit
MTTVKKIKLMIYHSIIAIIVIGTVIFMDYITVNISEKQKEILDIKYEKLKQSSILQTWPYQIEVDSVIDNPVELKDESQL